MEKITETRTVRCRYGHEEEYMTDLRQFGWSLVSSRIINRFGNPLPLDEKVSEEDLKEKCFMELNLTRTVNSDIVEDLNKLQIEYNSLGLRDISFGAGKITSTIFLTIATFSFVYFGIRFLKESKLNGITFLVLAAIALGGAVSIAITGAFIIRRKVIENNNISERRSRLAWEASEIIRKSN